MKTEHKITFTLGKTGKVETNISEDLLHFQIPYSDLIKAKLLMDKIFAHYSRQTANKIIVNNNQSII